MSTSLSACPACSAMPMAQDIVARTRPVDSGIADKVVLSLPGIHCAGCIAGVERVLGQLPQVRTARVNLTQKRVTIEGAAALDTATLIANLAANGYEAHELNSDLLTNSQAEKTGRDLVMRLAVAGFAAMNVMLLSVAVWSGAEGATRDMFHWISAAITLPTIAFSAQPFFVNAWSALRVRRLNMDVPISLAILLAVVTSLWETALSGEHAYFDAALALTFFLLAGRWLDHRTRGLARSAAQELSALEVARAWKVTADGPAEVALSEIVVGDQVLVHPGTRLPVDGQVIDGSSETDRSLLTGETRPIAVSPGDQLSAGEINLTGPLTLRATAVGQDSTIAKMAELVAIAESGRSLYTPLADRAAKLYAPGVHILSALSFVGWFLWSGDMRIALNIAAAVLIITCPCALGLAVPAVTTAASGRLFRRGLLIKNATALERLAEVDTVVFDKTGTLTNGTPKAVSVLQYGSEAASLALALAQTSAHPLSRALAAELSGQGVQPALISDVREQSGFGVAAEWQGTSVRLGRASWLGVSESEGMETWLQIGTAAPLRFGFEDQLRNGAEQAVRQLQAAGLKVVMMSGDASTAVARAANQIGIKEWLAEASPADKAAKIAAMSAHGQRVLMVGDGLNDTAALTAAHASISPASALDAARVASDMVLLAGDLTVLPAAHDTAKRATSRIKENFRIATLYNVIAVPLAIAGMATPLIAALAMSLSSITVSLNALRLGAKP